MTKTYAQLLPQYISYKSISTDPKYKEEVAGVVSWLMKLFVSHGFKTEEVNGYDNPIVIARYDVSPKAETVLIYGHYDVQPAEKQDGWDSDPFEVVEKNGRLYARGAVDNKGQLLVHISTVFDLIQEKKLRYNVVFMVEGNEETGSPALADFVKKHSKKIAADFALISDGETTGGYPTIDLSFRGVVNLQLTLTTSDRELHSGLFGGAVPNAGQILCDIVSSFYDKNRRVTIPGFYNDAEPVDKKLLKETHNFPIPQEEMRVLSGCSTLLLEKGMSFYTKIGLLPTLEVTGFMTGYMKEGFKNSVPPVAQVKLNVRTAPTQDSFKQADTIIPEIKKYGPSYAKLEVFRGDINTGILLSRNHPYMKRVEGAMNAAYDKKAVFKYGGGSLPIATELDRILHIPQVYASIGNEDCNMHAAKENYDLKFLNKALVFSRLLLSKE